MLIKASASESWNSVIDASGDLVVRPGLISLKEASDIEASHSIAGGFSIRSPNTGEVFHYLFLRHTSTGNCLLQILTQEFTELYRFDYNVYIPDNNVSFTYAMPTSEATTSLELIIASPSLPTLYGLLGGSLAYAVKVDSVNPGTTALDIPSGIAIGFAGRIVLASGRLILFSDAKAPQTFVGVNVDSRQGNVWALHVIPGGNLIAFTDSGAWSLAPDALVYGQKALALWQKLDDIQTSNWLSSSTVQGRVMALVDDGVRDIVSGSQISLAAKKGKRVLTDSRSWSTFRNCRMFASESDLYVSSTSHLWTLDMAGGFQSRWTLPVDSLMCGVLHQDDGSHLLLFPDRIVQRHGNEDWDSELPSGGFYSSQSIPGESSIVVRYVTSMADGYSQNVSVRGIDKTGNTLRPGEPIIGTSEWDTGALFGEIEMRSHRHNFAVRTDSLEVEMTTEGGGRRIGDLSITAKGVGRGRP